MVLFGLLAQRGPSLAAAMLVNGNAAVGVTLLEAARPASWADMAGGGAGRGRWAELE